MFVREDHLTKVKVDSFSLSGFPLRLFSTV